jgi:hypothetical protein
MAWQAMHFVVEKAFAVVAIDINPAAATAANTNDFFTVSPPPSIYQAHVANDAHRNNIHTRTYLSIEYIIPIYSLLEISRCKASAHSLSYDPNGLIRFRNGVLMNPRFS